MAKFTIKDIPDDLYAELEKMAAADQRTINEEIIYCIEQSLRGNEVIVRRGQVAERSVEAIIAEARRISAEIGPLPHLEEIFDEFRKTDAHNETSQS